MMRGMPLAEGLAPTKYLTINVATTDYKQSSVQDPTDLQRKLQVCPRELRV